MREYGLIGFPLSHSFSQKYFTEKFVKEGILDAVFHAFSIPQISDLDEVLQQHPALKGFAITIPYKRAVISYLTETSNAVKKTGACNCVKIEGGILTGFNTDVIGFENSFITQLQPHHTKALILGTGGAASAVEFVLDKLGLPYLFVSRTANPEKNILGYDEVTADVIKDYPVIINCTPLGTYPKTDAAPPIPYEAVSSSHYLFDLVYNPPVTKFLQYGKDAGAATQNGYNMLVIQAEENWKIWNGYN
ncbi:MAG TPA: shikimate dehydrogenase [Chitinophagaceae bacterium]|nr:shikimate dehydrogenase [Chitinophagaceae bacterium]